MKEKSENAIRDVLTENWSLDERNGLPYSGKSVREALQKILKEHGAGLEAKAGAIYRTPTAGDDNLYHLLLFENETRKQEYLSDPEGNAGLVLDDVSLPDQSVMQASFVVGLRTADPTVIISTDNTVRLQLRFTSQLYSPIDNSTTDSGEAGTLTVQTRADASEAWSTKGSFGIPSLPADGAAYTEADITGLLAGGTQQVRVIAKGEESGMSTNFLSFTVTKTALALNFATAWEVPQTGPELRLHYRITGAVDKTLNIRTLGAAGMRTFSFAIGSTVYQETPFVAVLTDEGSDNPVCSHGVHSVEAWLSVPGQTAESAHVKSQVLLYTDTGDLQPHVVLNDVAAGTESWVTSDLFRYAVYNPAQDGTPLLFRLTDYGGGTEYLRQETVAENHTAYTFTGSVETDSALPELAVYLETTSAGVQVAERTGFEVDNRGGFAPTAGADFVFSPGKRSNSEAARETVTNDVTGEAVESSAEGLGWDSDGYVATDAGKCFRLLAGQRLHIGYDPLQDFTQEKNTASMTLELDVMTRNVTDLDEPVLRVCSETPTGYPLGFEMKPTEACFMTAGRQTRKDQDIWFGEGVRTHIAVNIVYNLGGRGRNMIRLFVNKRINREFSYDTTDTFTQYVDGKLGSGGIRIGSDGADIDIFGIRVSRKELSEADIRKDYEATLPTAEEKRASREEDDILGDDGSVNYLKAKRKYRTMLWKHNEKYPHTRLCAYGDTKKTRFYGDLVIDDPAGEVACGTLRNASEKGQGTSSMSYWKWNQEWGFTEETYFEDERGRHGGYALLPGMPEAVKLCAKVNWASSPQSHKMGATALYEDLYRIVVGGNSITSTPGHENCRVAVRQMPFLLFVQEEEGTEPVFAGPVTFGPAKGDKPTFGCDGEDFPDFLMLEGADNGAPLVNRRIPWNGDIVEEKDDAGKTEAYAYNGATQWEIGLGSDRAIGRFVAANNFCYALSPNIRPYVGTLDQLQADGSADRSRHYWVTVPQEGSEKYDLYRWCDLTGRWVDAGVAKTADGYEKLNVNEQCGGIASGVDWEETNRRFVNVRVNLFANGVAEHYRPKATLFAMAFKKIVAAKDNRAKNTYEFLAMKGDPIEFMDDDLDSILLFDNVGRKTVPYYALEDMTDAEGNSYWNAYDNVFYRLMELAFGEELRQMTRRVFEAMEQLGGSVWGCMEKYFFSTQRYFPAVVYNETARIRYEDADIAMLEGRYNPNTPPLPQSLGDQLQAEMQWFRQREVFLTSYANYGQFAAGDAVKGALSFRSVKRKDGSNPVYSFTLTAHQWLFASIGVGDSVLYGRGNASPVMVRAGETVTLEGLEADGNTNVRILGVDHYRSVGDFGDKPLGEAFTLAGERLAEFDASGENPEFRPTSLQVTAPNLRRLSLKGVATAAGALDLTRQTRMETIELQGTGLSAVLLPATERLKSVSLPGTLTQLRIDAQPKLERVTTEGTSALLTVTLDHTKAGAFSSQAIAESLAADAAMGRSSLQRFEAIGVDWTGFALRWLDYYAMLPSCTLTGRVQAPADDVMTFEEKVRLISRFGNVDTGEGGLTVGYTVKKITGISILGDVYARTTGKKTYRIAPVPKTGNDLSELRFGLTENALATVTEDGTLEVAQLVDEEHDQRATLTARITKRDGTELEAAIELRLYDHTLRLGDMVYADGSYSDVAESGKTLAGFCFYIDPENAEDRRMVACKNLSDNDSWGISSGTFSGMQLEDRPEYSVYDIATMTNITNFGTNSVDNSDYMDESRPDGFRRFDYTTAAGYLQLTELKEGLMGHKAGEVVPVGKADTLRIIAHRNVILQDSSVGFEVPQAHDDKTEADELLRIVGSVTNETGSTNYKQYYYMAASLCYAYEPTGLYDGETLSDKLRAHQWYLPSAGELARICWYERQKSQEDTTKAIFLQPEQDGLMKPFGTGYYWSSSEYSATNAWNLNFGSGALNNNRSKDSGFAVRAVAAF